QASDCDVVTFEVWGALLHGSRLCGILDDALLSARTLAKELERREITTLFLTTPLFNQIVAQSPLAFQGIDHLLFGGDIVDRERVKQVQQGSPPKRLLHVYGPTESTVFATWHLVKTLNKHSTTVPIGRPLTNTEIYI